MTSAVPPIPAGDGLVWLSRLRLAQMRAAAENLPLRAVRIQSRMVGGHLSRFRGRGMEFDEARPYQPGDDVRSLDWRVTARTGQPHTKIYREERERAVLCWVDFRAPMRFATRGRFKSVQAAETAALIAWAGRRQGDRLGGLLFSEAGHQELRPLGGDEGVLRLLGGLSDYSASPAQASDPELRRAAIQHALMRLRRVARPGSLIFLLSDFRGLNNRCETHLSALARHNDLVLLHLYDPLEAELPVASRFLLTDGRRTRTLDCGDAGQRRHHQERFLFRRQKLEELSRRHRMHLIPLATTDDAGAVLRQMLGRQPR
jgi:uncharacterized protein (DUF58 family)